MKLTSTACVLFLTACVSASGAVAAPPQGPYFYEEGVKRPLTVVPDLVAEMHGGGEGALQAALAGAEVLNKVGTLTVLKVTPQHLGELKANAKLAAVKTSPVFHEGNTPAGRLMALPGGVVVQFKPEWTAEQISAFAAKRGLAVEQKLAIPGNWVVLATAPGTASLDAANSIQESGAVLSASPNWWKQSSPK